MVIQLRAKVKLISEDNLEMDHLEIDFKDSTWVWTDIGILTGSIDKLVRYTKQKTLIYTVDGEKILAQEDFDSLFATWQEAERRENELEEEETEENNEESEDISDEEEE